jgi:hypothetical protein
MQISHSIEHPVFHQGTDIWMIFFTHELMCTSIPVSRKKILTITHPSAPFIEAAGAGSLHERRPMRTGQILLCQPVVTNHNSFSGCPPHSCEVHQSRITHGTTSFLCPEVWFRRYAVIKNVLSSCQYTDTAGDNLISASLIIE